MKYPVQLTTMSVICPKKQNIGKMGENVGGNSFQILVPNSFETNNFQNVEKSVIVVSVIKLYRRDHEKC
jgi:hypothetical protein